MVLFGQQVGTEWNRINEVGRCHQWMQTSAQSRASLVMKLLPLLLSVDFMFGALCP